MPGSAVVAAKGQELLEYAKSKYQDEISCEGVSVGHSVTVHALSLNGVEINLTVGQHILGVNVLGSELLYEARGACAPVLGQHGFLVFGARDLSGRLVRPFFVRVYEDDNPHFIADEEHVEQAEALFRMFLTLAVGW